jgi:hypothetical protein
MHLHELRREDSADGAGIDRSVGVAASLPVDRAGVHAGSATDAAEGLTLGFFGQHPGAAVVEQDDMKALGSVAGRDPGPDRGVGIHALAGGGAGQHLEHHFKVLEAGEHLLNAGDGDHGARQGETHAAVALRLDHDDGAGFSDKEVGATDGGGDREKLLAQISAGGGGEGMGIVREILEAHGAGEDFADLAAVHVQGRDDDVGGFVLAELQDDLGQIGLVRADAGRLKKGIELNLGGSHGLDLDDFSRLLLAQDVENNLADLGRIGSPVDDAAGRCAAGFKDLKIRREILKNVAANGGACGAESLPVRFFLDELAALGLDHVNGVCDVLAKLRIAQNGQNSLWKRLSVARVEYRMGKDRAVGVVAHETTSAGEASVAARICAR